MNVPETIDPKSSLPDSSRPGHTWIWDVLLIGILLIGAYFRFTGISWDASYHLHPDERFLTMVETAIEPVHSLGEYFNTATSTLNPANRGNSYFVYGTLPLFLTRYVAQWTNMTGYDQVNLVGRVLSAIFDLGTIIFVYLIAKRLYRNPKLGLLAALLSALAVLQIQLSHYFTVDTFANLFVYAALYVAVLIMTADPLARIDLPVESEDDPPSDNLVPYWLKSYWGTLAPYALFGILFGMGMACKVSIWPAAALLPLAAYLHYLRQPKDIRENWVSIILRNLVLGGIIAFLTFRIFQPYAFMGPGFFGMKINPNFISSLKEISTQSQGLVDVPFALQWVGRPDTFALTNMVEWGLGIAFGLVAWGGFLWMGWRMIKGDFQKHMLLWTWTGVFFVINSISWVKAMRYQLPIYPALALIAAWAVFKLWETNPRISAKLRAIRINWPRILSIFLAVVVVVSTGLWAFAFTQIYTRPVTRVSASEWIYQNVNSAISMPIVTGESTVKQLLPFRNGVVFSADKPLDIGFTLDEDAQITSVDLEHVGNMQGEYPTLSLVASILTKGSGSGQLIAAGFTQSTFQPMSDARGDPTSVAFDFPAQLSKDTVYLLSLSVGEPVEYLKLYGSIEITYKVGDQIKTKVLPSATQGVMQGSEYDIPFVPRASGVVKSVDLYRIVDLQLTPGEKTLNLYLSNNNNPTQTIASGTLIDTFLPTKDVRGDEKTVTFDQPVALDQYQQYTLHIQLAQGSGALAIYNDSTAIESTWDDPLPIPMDGYDVFSYDTGIYGNVENFEMYWDDNAAKVTRMENILDQSDYIFISSNRQWGTITRLPERYPLSTEYYRTLIGCPDSQDILTCYQNATPGMYQGQLGFDLVQIEQSNPNLGSFQINDQSAEEAFTVYDHPKVLIFKKNASYDSAAVHSLLESVDISNTVHLVLREAGNFKSDLTLAPEALKTQQAGGTWTQIFDPASWVNQSQVAAVVVWYLAILLLGWMVYPMVHLALNRLPDRGFPASRLIGLLLFGLFTFWAGSSGLTFSRTTMAGVLIGLFVTNAVIAVLRRKQLAEDIRTHWKLFLIVEGLMLVFFGIDLLIRYNNPDLWHPWRGGEKPMDLSYLTAVIKSTTFPPFDPWYSGGYINYYYYGYVLYGAPVKLLGINVDVAYNLILPTLFGLTAIGAFSIGWNVFARNGFEHSNPDEPKAKGNWKAFGAGISSTLLVLVLGNLGTLRMIWQGWQKLVAPGGIIADGTIFQHLAWAWDGLGKMLAGAKLPYGYGDWLWIPSRALPGDTITEFPFFTFTYADLHAHLIALSITLLVIVWGMSILFSKWQWWKGGRTRGWIELGASLFLGGLAIGALRPVNTWDYPTYLALSAVILLYVVLRYAATPAWLPTKWPEWLRKLAVAAAVLIVLYVLSSLLYIPWSRYYDQAYGTVDAWTGDKSPIGSYLVHWGLFLFIIVSWLVWETREWLAATPVSALKKLKPHKGTLQMLGVLFLVILIVLAFMKIQIGWIAFPIAVWVLILLFRPGMPDLKRLVLFMIGTAMFLTIFVELFALQGDVGRMNTVFKFYYQAWTLLGLSSAAALGWLIPAVSMRWKMSTSSIWQVALAVLVFGAALYPLTAVLDKIRDRYDPTAPKTLDGTIFMKTTSYTDVEGTYELSQDYDGIKWMQENVIGSPVLIEANTVEYRWGNRYTIYTGLPGVLGWNYHQRQQRGFIDYNGISERLIEIPVFYTTSDVQEALGILQKYNVSYIILGQEERDLYPGDGLLKFEQYDGVYWKKVFSEKDTVIYEVLR